MDNPVYQAMKRLLEYSGTKVNSVSESEDGFIFDTELAGKEVRIFVTNKPQDLTFLNYLDSYDFPELVNY